MVVVSTAIRPKSDYLPATLAALDSAGASAFSRMVISDGPLRPGYRCPWPVIERAQTDNSRDNLWAAFRLAVDTNADRLLYFEDDVLPSQNAVTTMASIEIPDDIGWMTFFDRREVQEGASPGVYRRTTATGAGFWSTVALAFPARTCAYLADKGHDVIERPHGADIALALLMMRSPWPDYGVYVPCLVEHVGEESLVHGGKVDVRQTRNSALKH